MSDLAIVLVPDCFCCLLLGAGKLFRISRRLSCNPGRSNDLPRGKQIHSPECPILSVWAVWHTLCYSLSRPYSASKCSAISLSHSWGCLENHQAMSTPTLHGCFLNLRLCRPDLAFSKSRLVKRQNRRQSSSDMQIASQPVNQAERRLAQCNDRYSRCEQELKVVEQSMYLNRELRRRVQEDFKAMAQVIALLVKVRVMLKFCSLGFERFIQRRA